MGVVLKGIDELAYQKVKKAEFQKWYIIVKSK